MFWTLLVVDLSIHYLYPILLSFSLPRRFVHWAPEAYRGGPLNPLSEDDLAAKLAACADGLLDRDRQDKLLRAVKRVDKLANAAMIPRLIQP